MGKPSGGKTGKSSGNENKNSTSSGSKKPTTLGSSGKSLNPFTPGSSKNYSTSSSNTPKSKTSFGILWIPTKRHNKKKDMVFNSHKDDKLRERERSPSMYNLMSGDSDNNRKKKEEEATLLVPDKVKSPLPSVTSAVVATEAVAEASTSPEEKHEFIQRDKGDTNEPTSDNNDKDYLENNENDDLPELKTADKSTEWDRGKIGDKVDSVYLRSPPPHKARSTASTTAEDDDCGIKCLYFTLQCCDCVLM